MQPHDLLTKHLRIDTPHQKALARLQIKTVQDLLYHFPSRYENIDDIQSVQSLTKDQEAIVYGQLSGLKTRKAWKSKRPIAEGFIEDGTAKIKIMWFNQPYLAKMYQDGMLVKLVGKVTGSEGKLYIANPEVEKLDSLPLDRHDSIFNQTESLEEAIYPIYKETKGVTSRWLYHTALKCFEAGILENIIDPLPEAVRTRYHLPVLKDALVWIHAPKKLEHAKGARKRFAFEEVFTIQVQKAAERAAAAASNTYEVVSTKAALKSFTDRFPFTLTKAQTNAITNIITDLKQPSPMGRLLEGDVGSGKTAVAASVAYTVATSRPPEGKKTEATGKTKDLAFGNLQVAYMAPTEILAKQHFESFIEYFKHLPIQIGLVTGSGCQKFPSKSNPHKPTKISKNQLLKWVQNGEIPILIGTHALMYKKVEFKHLALVIIDEQHRFGTNQRKALAKKDNRLPHLLSMTATPIPRTLALTLYGDLDLTILDEMPTGRKPIITEIVGPGQEAKMYDHVRSELATGRQAYVICPRIDEPDPTKETALQTKSVMGEVKRLQASVFSGYRIGALHGKMTPDEKDKTMARFANHELDVLVATSVVEVGVNVPNATNIIIEGAERFGLAQLHQLRGRVLRGTHQPYCFVVTSSKSDKTRERLHALHTARTGFDLAEYDLQFRGAGELYGGKQSGLTDMGMEALKNLKLVEAARDEARQLVQTDPQWQENYPELSRAVAKMTNDLHLE